MTKEERQYFIERMEEFGDVWEDADVKRVYGRKSLQDALDERIGVMNAFASIIGTILNN